MKSEKIAAICYAAARVVSVSAGQDVPVWSRAKAYEKIWMRGFVACCQKNPGSSMEHRHDRWVALMADDDWKQGKDLDYDKKVHPNLVPFLKLSGEERFRRQLIEAIVLSCSEKEEEE